MVGVGVSEVGIPASSEESVKFGRNRHRKSKAHSNKARKAAKEATAKKSAGSGTESNPEHVKVQGPGDRSAGVLTGDQFLESLLQTLYRSWLQLRRLVDFVMSELGGNDFLEATAAWCTRNPHVAICLLAGGLVFMLPFLIIFGFGIATMVMTFTGLLVLEGTLLTIVSMVFFACLGGLVIMVPLFGVAAVAAYFGFAQVYGLCDGMELHKNAWVKFFRDQRKAGDPPPAVTITDEPTPTTA
ncbi:uncharacterized protein LOC6724898 isoform X1 [Drosophila simulans]|uniref:uncharacterized protein LOC6724898 isoform X1 n=1 Tax=Drosophila simulans TaxID=7240 RepID=UPI00078AECCE|nr:uncharacterized protein LOC6724898 isoform X1 [Drosophila simulans]KMZ07747.1 uncharacterized protein Dsimw501_GD16404, isoform B [Drosophila simulans]